jgi:DNA-binding NtrC family response regulator
MALKYWENKRGKYRYPVVMISGHGNIETAVDCIKKGAFDFIEKPIDLNRLLITVRNALDKKTLVNETKVLKKKVDKRYELIGNSAALEKVREMIARVAPTEARVLITGENGTGKEVIARHIYQLAHVPTSLL